MSSSYNQTNLITISIARTFGKGAKGCLGFACGILTGVAIASTLAIFQQPEGQESIQNEVMYIRASSPCRRMKRKKPSRKKKVFTGRKIRFADEVDKKLVHIREFVKGSPICATKNQ